MQFSKFVVGSLISAAIAAPAVLERRQEAPFQPEAPAWNAGATTEYPIHSSCNTTQYHQLALGLKEAIILAEHAKKHILRWGNESDIYRKYFGNSPFYEAIGAYEIIVNGDKAQTLFRCDNPDGNCDIPTWGGHWRGENGTHETVICDLSYSTRRSLNQMCSLGYTVANSPTNTFWASDLMHRLYHLPVVGGEYIEHFADDYEQVLQLAQGNTSESTRDSDTLQYFALEAYAYDIAVPGVGCAGEVHSSPASATISAIPPPATGSPSDSQPPSTTSAAAACHTHSDGTVHCE